MVTKDFIKEHIMVSIVTINAMTFAIAQQDAIHIITIQALTNVTCIQITIHNTQLFQLLPAIGHPHGITVGDVVIMMEDGDMDVG
jgi:hypothetical protein